MKTPGTLTRMMLIALATVLPLHAQSLDASHPATGSSSAELERHLRADIGFLASDAMRGRGSATEDEHRAALYIAAQFTALGLEPAGDSSARGKGIEAFIQTSPLPNPLPDKLITKLKDYEPVPRTQTYNAIALVRGTDPKVRDEVLLLTAHLDHLGICPAVNGDSICNGADDDASGTAAVLEFARLLAHTPPRRTVVFALFGSEEIGGYGNQAFLAHPPVPIDKIVANIEFEMIGRPDPLLPAGTLWLTGYERSFLGPELAKHGAHWVADPRPEQKFFQRSDNYALAKQGIIAHTVSSFGMHTDYHHPSDDVAHIDFAYMTSAVGSLIEPITWLANSYWRPRWTDGGKPE